jgi:hypothetical protein
MVVARFIVEAGALTGDPELTVWEMPAADWRARTRTATLQSDEAQADWVQLDAGTALRLRRRRPGASACSVMVAGAG